MVVAGRETTLNLITNAVPAQCAHRDQPALVLAGQATGEQAVEETLRWDSPVSAFPLRYAAKDLTPGPTVTPPVRRCSPGTPWRAATPPRTAPTPAHPHRTPPPRARCSQAPARAVWSSIARASGSQTAGGSAWPRPAISAALALPTTWLRWAACPGG